MHPFDSFVIFMNVILASVALVVNVRATFLDDVRRRVIYATTAGLLVLYILGYSWLLVSQDELAWSRLFRGVSLVAWPVAWMAPAWYTTKLHREDVREIQRLAREELECSGS